MDERFKKYYKFIMDKEKNRKSNIFWGVVVVLFFVVIAIAIGKDLIETVIFSYKK